MPDHRDIAESVRREKAAELGVDAALAQALVDLEPPCAWKAHATGETGCEPGAPAEFVIRLRPHCARDRAVPQVTILLVCQAQQIRLRSRVNETTRCACGKAITWSQVLDFLGPIVEYHA